MSEATCVEEETDPSTSRKMTSSAVRASPGRFNEASFEAFLRDSGPGDYFVSADAIHDPRVIAVRSNGRYHLYRRSLDDASR